MDKKGLTWDFMLEHLKKAIEEGKPSDKGRAMEVVSKVNREGGYAGEEGKGPKDIEIEYTGWVPPKALGKKEDQKKEKDKT